MRILKVVMDQVVKTKKRIRFQLESFRQISLYLLKFQYIKLNKTQHKIPVFLQVV